MDNNGNGGGKGALFGVIVIILLLIAGGLYLGFKNTTPQEPVVSTETPETSATTNTSLDQTSDAIEADLNNPDLQTLDDDAADVNAALAQ